MIQRNRHLWDGKFKLLGNNTNTDQWFFLQVLMNTQCGRRSASDCLNAISILCKESQNLFRGLSGRAVISVPSKKNATRE